MQDAQNACKHLLPNGGELSPEQQAQAQENALKFARCMRDQGITDFPDPDQQGRFVLPPSLDQGGTLKSSARWPQVQAAMDGPCRQYNPSGHI